MSLFQKQPTSSMNLPVSSHIDKLSQLIQQMGSQIEIAQKQLHILRGQITELSFVNKESDQELNQYLIDSISSLRFKWEGEWEGQAVEISQCKKKVAKIFQDQQDIEILREELQEKVQTMENLVGIL